VTAPAHTATLFRRRRRFAASRAALPAARRSAFDMTGLAWPARSPRSRLLIPSLTVVDSPEIVTPLTVPVAATQRCTDLGSTGATYVDVSSTWSSTCS
jgi:hypothetical protein